MEFIRNSQLVGSGFPDGTLRPQGSASRVQISKMLITLVQTDQPEAGVG